MGAPDLLARLAAAGIRLTLVPDARIRAEPREELTDELRELIRDHRAELLRVLSAEAPRTQARRQRVLDLLAANPEATYATVTDMQADPDAVILALAMRGQASCELRIPRAKWDGTLFLDLMDRHGGTVH